MNSKIKKILSPMRSAMIVGLATVLLVNTFFANIKTSAAPTLAITTTVLYDGENGVVPFDSNNNPGNDSGPLNGILRTNDKTMMKWDVSVNGDNATNLRITHQLPLGMKWITIPTTCFGTLSVDLRTLYCNLGNVNAGTTLNVSGATASTNENTPPPNGSILTDSGAILSANGATSVTSNTNTWTISSQPRYDILFGNGYNQDITYESATGPLGEPGYLVTTAIKQTPLRQIGSEDPQAPYSFTITPNYVVSSGTPVGAKLYSWGSQPSCGDVFNSSSIIKASCSQVSSGAPITMTVNSNQGLFEPLKLRLWIPTSDFAVTNNLTGYLEISNYDPNSISGQSNFGAGLEFLGNNTQSFGLSSNFVYNIEKINPKGNYSGEIMHSGEIGTWRTQITSLSTSNSPSDLIICDKFDQTHQSFQSANVTSTPNTIDTSSVVIEYTDTAFVGNQANSNCENSEGPWYPTTSAVPSGIGGITRIRARNLPNFVLNEKLTLNVTAQIKNVPDFTIVNNISNINFGGANKPNAFASITIIKLKIESNILIKRTDETYYSNSKNFIAGNIVDYELTANPRSQISNIYNPQTTTLIYRLRLPLYHTYLANSATIVPSSIVNESGGTTLLTWIVPNYPVQPHNTPSIPKIIKVSATTSIFTPNNINLTSKLWLDSPDAPNQSGFFGSCVGFSYLCRLANAISNIQNTNSYNVQITSPQRYIATNQPIGYEIKYGNITNVDIPNTDIISILPYNGDYRTPSSNFGGTATLGSITTNNSEIVLYTKSIPSTINPDPCDPTNIPNTQTSPVCSASIIGNGNTIWCTSLSGGNCPSNNSEVTGVRIQGGNLPSGTVRDISMIINTNGNTNGNIYSNSINSRAAGLGLQVNSAVSSITVGVPSIDAKVANNPNSIAQNDGLNYQLDYYNNSTVNIEKTDLIHILPYNGDGRTPTSNFAGNVSLIGIFNSVDQSLTYTKAIPSSINSDPCDPSNIDLGQTLPTCSSSIVGTGLTVWCSALSGGSCPSSYSEVKAIRATGNLITPNIHRTININLSTNSNQNGDIYSYSYNVRTSDTPNNINSNTLSTLVSSGVISGRIFNDANNNAVDDGENGIQNISVRLKSAGLDDLFGTFDDPLVRTTSTNIQGEYSFGNTAPGKYQINVTRPVGTNPSFDKDGIITPDTVTDQTITFSSGSGVSSITDINFGYNIPPPNTTSIQGKLFKDKNNNNFFDSGDEYATGYLYLYRTSDNSFVDFISVNNANAGYSFSIVNSPAYPDNSYYIQAYINDSAVFDSIVTKNVGGSTVDSDINQNNKTDPIVIANNQVITNIDAGFYSKPKFEISGKLFKDINKNNYFDGGDEYADGGVYLYRTIDDSFVEYKSVCSSNSPGCNGEYSFSLANNPSYPSNSYYIRAYQFDNTFDGIVTKNIGGTTVDSDINQDNKSDPIITVDGQTYPNVDAGFYIITKTTISGKIFKDINKNNYFDGGDEYAPGLVYLKRTSNPSFSLYTPVYSNGQYSFSFIPDPLMPNDTYYIQASINDSLNYDGVATKNVGGSTVDSDINPNRQSDPIPVVLGQAYSDIDAGFYYKDKATVNGRIFKDINKNNFFDAGDEYTSGSAYLKRVGDPSFQIYKYVGGNGEYSFSFSNSDDFPANTYYIETIIEDNYNFDSVVTKNVGASNVDSDINPDGKTDTFVAVINSTLDNIDAGYFSSEKLNVHGRIFNDVNKNNYFDGGDSALYSYVEVFRSVDSSSIGVFYSDSFTGEYDINLVPGSYYLKFNQPTNTFAAVQKNIGGSAVDSDIDPITLKSDTFTLTLGDPTLSIDAGFYEGEADLSIVKTSSGGSNSTTGNEGVLYEGDLIYYNLMVTNNGPDTANLTTYITDTFDDSRLIFDHASGVSVANCYLNYVNEVRCDFTNPLINGQVENIQLYFLVRG
jgi:SdrD B-like domain